MHTRNDAATDLEELHDRLRTWAKGLLPSQAAVEFLIATGSLSVGHPMVAIDDGYVWLDLSVDDDTWAERTGYMSSGERATWRLARSIFEGELNDTFWRLDGDRQTALLTALETYR